MFNVQVHMKENYELSLANLDSVVVSLHEQPNSLEGRHEYTNDVPDIRLAKYDKNRIPNIRCGPASRYQVWPYTGYAAFFPL